MHGCHASTFDPRLLRLAGDEPRGGRGPGRGAAATAARQLPRLRTAARAARPARRRPRGAARAARRGAAQRLPADAGDRAALRRRLAAEPRLGLPGAPAARGRGAGRASSRARAARPTSSPTRAAPRSRRAATSSPTPWDAVKGDMGEGAWELMGAMRQIGMALFQLTHSGTEAQQARGQGGARRHPPGALPDPRRGSRARRGAPARRRRRWAPREAVRGRRRRR